MLRAVTVITTVTLQSRGPLGKRNPVRGHA